jgi:hypothetical protein
LRSIKVSADPVGDRIGVELWWRGEPPDASSAAVLAGFVLTSEVVELVAELPDRAIRRDGLLR